MSWLGQTLEIPVYALIVLLLLVPIDAKTIFLGTLTIIAELAPISLPDK